jgi:hypothetical protein
MGPKNSQQKKAAKMGSAKPERRSPVVVDGGVEEEESAMDETACDDARAKPDEPYRKVGTKAIMEQLTSTIKSWWWQSDETRAGDEEDLDGPAELPMVLKESSTRDVTPENSARSSPNFRERTELLPFGSCPSKNGWSIPVTFFNWRPRRVKLP